MVEVMDHWQDAGLTAGEKSDLLVLAENANEVSRETVGPVHEPYLLRRAGKASPAAWRNAIGKLVKKGVLEYAIHDGREMSGFPGRWAVYRMVELCGEGPHDGLHGQCTRSERVTSQVTQSSEEGTCGPELGHPTGDPIDKMGHLSGANGSPDRCEWVTSQVTPNPPTPLTPPPNLPEPRSEQQLSGREGGGTASRQQDNPAFAALARIVAKHPQLALGETEIASLTDLVETWLHRTTEARMEAAITAGLPDAVINPAGFVRGRLAKKLPPAPQDVPAEERCGRPDCDPVTKMRTLPDHTLDFCPICHPTGRARARRQQGAAA